MSNDNWTNHEYNHISVNNPLKDYFKSELPKAYEQKTSINQDAIESDPKILFLLKEIELLKDKDKKNEQKISEIHSVINALSEKFEELQESFKISIEVINKQREQLAKAKQIENKSDIIDYIDEVTANQYETISDAILKLTSKVGEYVHISGSNNTSICNMKSDIADIYTKIKMQSSNTKALSSLMGKVVLASGENVQDKLNELILEETKSNITNQLLQEENTFDTCQDLFT